MRSCGQEGRLSGAQIKNVAGMVPNTEDKILVVLACHSVIKMANPVYCGPI